MKKHFCILFCLALLGCQEEKPKRPANLLDESKMVSILADVHTAEAQIESTVAYPDTALMIFNKLQRAIWEKHGITEGQFRDTYNYYLKHIPEMDKLYEIVTDTLIAREAKYATKDRIEEDQKDLGKQVELDSVRLEQIKRRGNAAPESLKNEVN